MNILVMEVIIWVLMMDLVDSYQMLLTQLLIQDNFNLRPVKFVLSDIDGDGDDEIIFADRGQLQVNGILV
jgi:hypothetical protein